MFNKKEIKKIQEEIKYIQSEILLHNNIIRAILEYLKVDYHHQNSIIVTRNKNGK